MRDPELLDRLEEIHGRLERSFLRYVAEVARPLVRTEWDRRAMDLYQAWYRDSSAGLAAPEELLVEEKVHPVPPSWPIHFSQYHLVSPVYLLRPVIERMGPHLASVRELAAGLSGWPEARQAVTGLLQKEDAHLQAVRRLEAERPREAPRPGVKKGVSANFW